MHRKYEKEMTHRLDCLKCINEILVYIVQYSSLKISTSVFGA